MHTYTHTHIRMCFTHAHMCIYDMHLKTKENSINVEIKLMF